MITLSLLTLDFPNKEVKEEFVPKFLALREK
jgi:hypothetical protein